MLFSENNVNNNMLKYLVRMICLQFGFSHSGFSKTLLYPPNAYFYQIKYYNMSGFNKRDICIYLKPHIFVTVLDYTYAFQEYI